MKREGILFVLSGPSGAGKGTVLKEVFRKLDGLAYSISATTRKPRAGEMEGVSYYFKTEEEFVEMIENDEFLEYVRKFGNLYGTPKAPVFELLKNGTDVLLEIETMGAKSIKENYKDASMIFITPSSLREIETRLIGRNTEDKNVRDLRVKIGKEEVKSIVNYDYIAINDDLESCVLQVVSIIEGERSKINRNKSFVDKILSEGDEKNEEI